MKKNFLLLNFFLIILFFWNNEALNNQTLPTQEELASMLENIDEDMLLNMMQEAIEQYKNFSEEEKEIMCRENNIKREDLDLYINEAKNELEKIKQAKPEQKKENQKTNNNEEKIVKNQPNQQNLGAKDEIQRYINTIKRANQTIDTLHLKCQDDTIRSAVTESYPELLNKAEIINYYFKIFLDFLNKYKDENKINLDKKNIEEIVNIANQINDIETTIARLITFEEYNKVNNFEDIFQKYKIKPGKNEELKIFLEEEILKLETKIEDLRKNTTLEKKKIKAQTADLEYKLNILEDDLSKIEALKKISHKNSTNLKEFKEKLLDSVEKIITKFNVVFEKNQGIKKVETFIKENFPKEYAIGKEKEKIQKEIKKREEQILNQRGSRSEISNERELAPSSYLSKNRKNNQQQQENFRYQETESNSDYRDSYDNEEDMPFNFPDQSENSLGRNSNHGEPKIENKKDTVENETKPEIDGEKKRSIISEKEKGKKNKIEKNQKKEKNSIKLLEEQFKETRIFIENFFEDFNSINEKSLNSFIEKLIKRIKKLTDLIKEISEKSLLENQQRAGEVISLKTITLKPKNWPKNIAEIEKEKISILNEIGSLLKQPEVSNLENENLSIFQILYYKSIALEETFVDLFNSFIKEKETESNSKKEENIKDLREKYEEIIQKTNIKNLFESLSDKIIEKYESLNKDSNKKNTIIQKYMTNKQDYWTLSKASLEKDLKTISDSEKTKKIE